MGDLAYVAVRAKGGSDPARTAPGGKGQASHTLRGRCRRLPGAWLTPGRRVYRAPSNRAVASSKLGLTVNAIFDVSLVAAENAIFAVRF